MKKLIFSLSFSLVAHLVVLDLLSPFLVSKEKQGGVFINANLSYPAASKKLKSAVNHSLNDAKKSSRILTKAGKLVGENHRTAASRQDELAQIPDQDFLYQYRINFARSLREISERDAIQLLLTSEKEFEIRVLKVLGQARTRDEYTVESISQRGNADAVALLKKVANQTSFPAGIESVTIRLVLLN